MNFHLGTVLKNQISVTEHRVPKPLADEFIEIDDFIIGRVKRKWVVYDRICDHNGGVLCLDKGGATATCHTHKWTLILSKATYENSCHKNTLPVREHDDVLVITKCVENFPEIDTSELTDSPIELAFNAHASFTLDSAGLRLTTDPWLIGSCFATGWWHAYPPTIEAIERLRQSDCIYISHNHPDHLHMPTLETYVAKNQLFLIPAFESGSVEFLLRRHGYNNLIVADFLQEVNFQTQKGKFRAMLVRAGDARDDSSLLFFSRNDTLFFGVDTNMPNRWVLPKVDVLFTPFAGGASGFPARIANFTVERKKEIITANRNTILTNHVDKLVKATRPSYIVPYAGYFTEAPRDQDVKEINKKNSAADLIAFVENTFPGIRGINPLDTPLFTLNNGTLSLSETFETPSYFLDEDYINEDLRRFTEGAPKVDTNLLEAIGRKLVASRFTDEFTVIIIPSDECFIPTFGLGLIVNFSLQNRGWRLIKVKGEDNEELIESLPKTKNNIEVLRIRADVMAAAIMRKLPLEDLSIGFQIHMYRMPNTYNFNFWNYFTNRELIEA